jgi:putative flippase GtrA
MTPKGSKAVMFQKLQESPAFAQLVRQMFKFGVVGLTASLIHVGVFLLCIETFSVRPLVANCIAFCVALPSAFTGHYYWTFNKGRDIEFKVIHTYFRRYFCTALFGFSMNSLVVAVVVNTMHMSHLYAMLLMITVVPVATFAISRSWAFSS